MHPLPLIWGRKRVAAGSGSAPEGLMPRRESLWLGEGWTIRFIPPHIHPVRYSFLFSSVIQETFYLTG